MSTPLPEKAAKAQVQATKPTKKLSYHEQRELTALPERIEALEAEKAAIEGRFCDPEYFGRDADGFMADQQRLDAIEAELAEAYARWEELEAKAEALAA